LYFIFNFYLEFVINCNASLLLYYFNPDPYSISIFVSPVGFLSMPAAYLLGNYGKNSLPLTQTWFVYTPEPNRLA